jgi:hypothetical protein
MVLVIKCSWVLFNGVTHQALYGVALSSSLWCYSIVVLNGVTCIGYHYCFSLCFQTYGGVHGVSPSFVVWDFPLLLMCRL